MPELLTGLLLTRLITVINFWGIWGQNQLLLTSLTLPLGGRLPGTDPRQGSYIQVAKSFQNSLQPTG